MIEISILNKIIKPYEIEQIKYLEANKNTTYIYFNDGQHKKACYTLLKFEKLLLKCKHFKRIHRSYIVNKLNISGIDIIGGFLRLTSGEIIPVSNNYLMILLLLNFI